MSRDNLGIIGDAVGLVGAAVSLVTLFRVSRVETVQRQERALLRELYGLDTLAELLTAASERLGGQTGKDVVDLTNRLNQMLGRVDGINRALAVAAPDLTPAAGDVRLIPREYFSDRFVSEACQEAQEQIDVIVYRNQQISNAFVLDDLVAASERGIQVRILALASDGPDEALAAARAIMPRPVPSTNESLRQQLAQNEESIADHLAQSPHHHISYRGYRMAPLVHMMVVDREIRYGLVGTLASAQPEKLLDRPYLVMASDSPPGEILVKHFDDLFESAIDLDAIGVPI